MKELTTEQKAQRYDEAIINGSRLWECGLITRETYEDIFHELKESEDERIKKALIHFISEQDGFLTAINGISVKYILAWLEKQGEKGTNGNEREIPNSEQKPADKVKPFDKYEGLTDFERTLADICIGWIGQELGWKQYIKDNADALLKIAIKKFNSVQDAIFEKKPAELSQSEVTKTSDQVQKPAECRQETKPNGGIVYEDFNEGDGSYKVNLAYLSKPQVELIEDLVDSWQNTNNNTAEWSAEDEETMSGLLSFLLINTSDQWAKYGKWLRTLKQRIGG